MKTVEELEAQLEGAKVMIDSLTRSLELAEAEIAVVRKELRATRKDRDEARDAVADALKLYPYVNCACGRGKPRISESLRAKMAALCPDWNKPDGVEGY
jgi:uncharacterized protein (DUF3084 family)